MTMRIKLHVNNKSMLRGQSTRLTFVTMQLGHGKKQITF